MPCWLFVGGGPSSSSVDIAVDIFYVEIVCIYVDKVDTPILQEEEKEP